MEKINVLEILFNMAAKNKEIGGPNGFFRVVEVLCEVDTYLVYRTMSHF